MKTYNEKISKDLDPYDEEVDDDINSNDETEEWSKQRIKEFRDRYNKYLDKKKKKMIMFMLLQM